jgi:hypothetical protein
MEGSGKMTGTAYVKIGQQETHMNHQESLHGDRVTTEKQTGGVANHWETSGGWRRKMDANVYIKALPHHVLTVITENADPSLVTQGCVSDKPCLVTVDTRVYVTVVRSDIATRWPKRQLNQHFTLQTVSG